MKIITAEELVKLPADVMFCVPGGTQIYIKAEGRQFAEMLPYLKAGKQLKSWDNRHEGTRHVMRWVKDEVCLLEEIDVIHLVNILLGASKVHRLLEAEANQVHQSEVAVSS